MTYRPTNESYNQASNAHTSRRRKKKKASIIKKTCLLLLSSIIIGSGAAVSFHGVSHILNNYGINQQTASVATNNAANDTTLISLSYSGETTSTDVPQSLNVTTIAQTALPSIVSITNISVQEVNNYFSRFGRNGRGSMQMEETTSCGSGILINQNEENLYIVTNNHVVENATTLSVTFADNTTCEATLCGTDSDRDLAVISVAVTDISEDTLNQISIAEIGDSDTLLVGEQVVAIGNALGYGQSVTTGIVSALDRALSDGSSSEANTYIQTDAAINPGNSGGALLNMSGQIIGINTAKLSSTEIEGMGYAIPISDVWEMIGEMMQQTPQTEAGSTANQQLPFGNAMPNEGSWVGIPGRNRMP